MSTSVLRVDMAQELEAREEAKSGNKAWLRRRLHAAIVRDYLRLSAALSMMRWMTRSCCELYVAGAPFTASQVMKQPFTVIPQI